MHGDPRPNLLRDLMRRGLAYQTTSPDLELAFLRGPVTGYVGFDPSASSFHVGHLLPVIALRRLQRAGHRPIAIVGGGTGLIGDPSGKQTEREMLTHERLTENVAGIRSQLEHFIDFGGSQGALLVNNADWLCGLHLVEFLRDIGKSFSVNEMIARDSVRIRLTERDQGISFTEFAYTLLQSYDFLHLYKQYGCTLQMGGSDQWGNIVSGCDLIRRKTQATTYGLTLPLILKPDGTKFGKTESGSVWLDPKRTTPFSFYQFWINTPDAQVVQFLHFFTDLPQERVDELTVALATAPAEREAQRTLAREVTTLVHGSSETQAAERVSEVLFVDREWTAAEQAELAEALADAPSVDLSRAKLGTDEARLVSILTQCRLASSKGDAKKHLVNGAISVNGRTVTEDKPLTWDDVLLQEFIVLRRGKKSYHVVRIAH